MQAMSLRRNLFQILRSGIATLCPAEPVLRCRQQCWQQCQYSVTIPSTCHPEAPAIAALDRRTHLMIKKPCWFTSSQGPSHAKASQLPGSAVPKQKTPAASKPINPSPTSKSATAKKQQQQQQRIETKAAHSLDPFAKPAQRKTHADPLTKASAAKPPAKINSKRQEEQVEFNGRSSKASAAYTSGTQEVDSGSSSQEAHKKVLQRPQSENARSSLVEENLVKLTMRLMGGTSGSCSLPLW